MFERFPTPLPIGSGLMLQPTGLAVLAAMGLAEPIVRQGQRIDHLHGVAGARTVLDVHYQALGAPRQFGVGIHRSSLFSTLFEAVSSAGISLHTGHTVVGSRQLGDQRVLQFAEAGESEPFGLVVDALGARSTLAPPVGRELSYGALWASLIWSPEAGLDPHTLSQRYHRSNVMAGILPTGLGDGTEQQAAFFWSLRADAHTAWREAGLAPWKARVARHWPSCSPYLDQISDAKQLTFARYAHRTVARPFASALIHLGDAWHSASPQLGQGANMALLDAWALAKAVSETSDLTLAPEIAVKMRKLHVAAYQALTWLFTPIYQSDSRVLPLLRDWLMGPLSKLWPLTALQASLVSGLVADPLRPLGLKLDLALGDFPRPR